MVRITTVALRRKQKHKVGLAKTAKAVIEKLKCFVSFHNHGFIEFKRH